MGAPRFRAYNFDEFGALVAELSANKGIREIQPATVEHYEHVLFELIGEWLSDNDIVLLSGMITSRSGWIETPYLACPVDVSRMAHQAQCLNIRNVQLRFLPGLMQEFPALDVMRGEEWQMLGVANSYETSIVVLPRTHSKWAAMNATVITQFRTIITGDYSKYSTNILSLERFLPPMLFMKSVSFRG